MKAFCVFFLLGIFATANAQTRVHAHNDYLNAEPCTAAYKSGAWSIEADVFLVNGKIMVAHTRDEVKEGATLEEMYLQKIKNLTAEKGALPMQLMIDIKDDFSATYPVLEQVLKPYFTSFRNKVQVTISGKRPDHATFNGVHFFCR
ncbi:MAG: alkaline phosphatase, partial [Chitinophagaceae bacterium]